MGMIQIDVLGTSFSIQAEEDSQYLEKLVSYYKKISNQIETSKQVTDPLKNAIISGIMICDELYKAKLALKSKTKQNKNIDLKEDEDINEILKKLNTKIDNTLLK